MTTSALPAPPIPSRLAGATRLAGIDLARLLAIVGMMATHLVALAGTMPDASPVTRWAAGVVEAGAMGVAAPLFAVLAGTSLVLATRRDREAGRTGAAVASVAVRGLVLVALGLVLGAVPGSIVVVLASLGVAMLPVAPAILAPSWVLAVAAGALAIGGGWANAALRGVLGVVTEGGSLTLSLADDPVAVLRAVLVTGMYPAITWIAYLLVGIVLGRVLSRASGDGGLRRTGRTLAAAGAAIATIAGTVSMLVVANLSALGVATPGGLRADELASVLLGQSFGAPLGTEWWAQLVATPHSGSIADLVRTTGLSLAVVGVLVALVDGRRRRGGRILRWLQATGAASLTIYALHVLAAGAAMVAVLLVADPTRLTSLPWWVAGLGILAIHVAGALALGAVLAATGRRGPLETLVGWVVRTATAPLRRTVS